MGSLPRYTYLGPAGTFSEQALRSLPESMHAQLVPVGNVAQALDDVTAGSAEAALVPLENSIEGSVRATVDHLISSDRLMIVRDVLLPVAFNLYAKHGSTVESVATVATHPHAEAQCRHWLRRQLPYANVVSVGSTADAARSVAAGEFDAAVCGETAGEMYALTVLAGDIGDNDAAVTRFGLVKRFAKPPAATGHDLTSLVVYIPHDRVGALLQVLQQFSLRGVNLSRIESRPTKEGLGRYCFYLDCEGHIADRRVADALKGLRLLCLRVRFLGSYPRAGEGFDGSPNPTPTPAGTTDADFAAADAWIEQLRNPDAP